MMKALNLLSPEERLEIRRERMFMILRNAVGIAIGVCLFASATLFISAQTIKNESDLLLIQAKAVDDRSEKINVKIGIINNMLADIEKMQKEDTPWDQHISSIIQTIPEGITLSDLSVDKESLIFEITGTAFTRQTFLTMKTQFEKNKDLFKEISTPALSLTAKDNIPFTLSGRLIIQGFTPQTKKTPAKQSTNSEQ